MVLRVAHTALRTEDVGDSMKAALNLRSVPIEEGRRSFKVFQAICNKKAKKRNRKGLKGS